MNYYTAKYNYEPSKLLGDGNVTTENGNVISKNDDLWFKYALYQTQ